jgi:DNA-binding NarL/FixJ family response regulator
MPGPAPTAMTDGVPPRTTRPGRARAARRHLAARRSTAAIAAPKTISTNTVRTRIRRLQAVLGAPARDQVVPRARTLGVL